CPRGSCSGSRSCVSSTSSARRRPCSPRAPRQRPPPPPTPPRRPTPRTPPARRQPVSTTLYSRHRSPIHLPNPPTKLIATLAIIVISFALPYWWVPVLLIVVVVVPAAVIARCGRRLLWIGLVLLLPI